MGVDVVDCGYSGLVISQKGEMLKDSVENVLCDYFCLFFVC